jgi:rhodanese-related sulfurtransferase
LASCNSQAQQANLSVAEFENCMAQNNMQVIDVRTPGEYQSWHLKSAMLADCNNDAAFQQRVKALDKSNLVYTCCLSGDRSSAATQYLKHNEFAAYNLSGGISAWKRDSKPVEQAAPVKQMKL